MSGIADIDTSGAAAAIDAAGGLDAVTRSDVLGTEATPTPQDQSQGATPQDAGLYRDPVSGRIVSRPSETPGQQEAAQETPFTSIDPNTLPDELKPIYKSLQADYTRKTQEAAELRKQYEGYGSPEELNQAVELYHSLQNPVNWPALYDDLRNAMENAGMSPRQAAEAAKQEVQAAQEQQGQWQGEPDNELQQLLSPLQKELQELRAEMRQRQEAEQQERLTQQMVNHIQRQEGEIRTANPNYNDDDFDAIYAIAPHFGGDLLKAQEKYEEIATSRLTRFLDAKQGHSSSVPGAVGGGDVQTTQPEGGFKSLDDAHKAAMESLRLMEAAD